MSLYVQFSVTELPEGQPISTSDLNAILSSIIITLQGAVDTGTIADNTITGAKLVNNNVDASTKLLDLSISTGKIANKAVTAIKLNSEAFFYGAATLTTGVYGFTPSPAPTAYITGQIFFFKADAGNLGAVDINANSLGAKNLYKNKSQELDPGDIVAGQFVLCQYDGTHFQMLTPTATDFQKYGGTGVLTTSTYAVNYITSAAGPTLQAGMVIRFKADTANPAGGTSLNVNGVGAKTIYKNTSQALDAGDIAANQIVEVIYDGTNFQLLSTPATTIVTRWVKYDGTVRTLTNNGTTNGTAAITSAAHGLATGQPCVVIGVGSLPAPLDHTAIYFLRSLTAGTFSLHPTLADANANTNALTPAAGTIKVYYITQLGAGVGISSVTPKPNAATTAPQTGFAVVTFTTAYSGVDAYAVTAVGKRSGGSGVLLVNVDPAETASASKKIFWTTDSSGAAATGSEVLLTFTGN